MSMAEKVADFIGFTGANETEAANYLEMAGGNLEQAVNLFMEMGGGGGGGGGAPGGGGADDDAAAAAAAAAAADEDEVRAPIAAFQDRIINEAEDDAQRMLAAVQADALAMQQRMVFDRAEANDGKWSCTHCKNQNFTKRDTCFVCGSRRETPSGSSSNSVINSLFKPPSYNEASPFFQTLEKAKSEGKWVLVNIQASDAFQSHALNRDVWNDETVGELIAENFIFWQRDNLSTEGGQFCRNYKCEHDLPHICMIDPRTGRSIKAWKSEKWAQPSEACSLLFEFMERHPAPQPSGSPPAAAPSTATVTIAATTTTTSTTSTVVSSSSASISATTSVSSTSATTAAATAPAASDAPTSDSAAAATTTTNAATAATPSAAGGASGVSDAPEAEPEKESTGPICELPAEPPQDQTHSKVVLKMPSGKRVVRRILPTDTLEVIFKAASALCECPMDLLDISTQMPKKSLYDFENGLACTVADAKVAGNMLVVETGKRRKV